MRSQPAVYGGRVIAGGQDGSVYALDMKTGCVYWATTVQSQVRSGITVGEAGGNPAVFFGDSAGFVYALDATSGKQLWKARAGRTSGIHCDRDAGVLQGSLVCRGRFPRGIDVGFSRLPVLHVSRQRVGSGCRYRKGSCGRPT